MSQFYRYTPPPRNLGNLPNCSSRILDTIKDKDTCWQRTHHHLLPAPATVQYLYTNCGSEEGSVPTAYLLHCPFWVQVALLLLLVANLFFAFSKSVGVLIFHWRLDVNKRTWESSFLSENNYLLDNSWYYIHLPEQQVDLWITDTDTHSTFLPTNLHLDGYPSPKHHCLELTLHLH